MKSSQKYFLLAALFALAYLVVTYTDIYGSSNWFRISTAIVALVYVINGLNHLQKEKKKKTELIIFTFMTADK
ncbi:hypothetical protein N9502_00530 [Vicingaceae bacterium]|nr:hypothetical protein [Vicingaceae bacterium]